MTPSCDGFPVVPAGTDSPLSHDIADYPDGVILPIDKPYRWTSADVIRKVKYAAVRHFRKKNLKVGHAGTLDPLATGVLLVCIGPATRRAQQLQDHDKEYVAGISFGATTPSYDLEKEVDRLFPFDHVDAAAVRAVLPSFVGAQEQVAPLFSAKSVDGVRAYEMARKLYRNAQKGIVDPDFDAAALATLRRSPITIHEVELLDFRSGPALSSALSPATSLVTFPVTTSAFTQATSPVTRPVDALPDTPPGTPVLPPVDAPASTSPETSAFPPVETQIETSPGTPILHPVTRSMSGGLAASNASSRIHVTDTTALGLPHADIRIACSKGTYIRAFARDLGEALGTGAHLDSLVRTRTGDFRLEDALPLDAALALLAE